MSSYDGVDTYWMPRELAIAEIVRLLRATAESSYAANLLWALQNLGIGGPRDQEIWDEKEDPAPPRIRLVK